MKLWIMGRYGDGADWLSSILLPGSSSQRKWTVRADWLASFVQTSEYQRMHRDAKDADPMVILVRSALTTLGWPDVVAPGSLGFEIPPRRVAGIMMYLGYEAFRNSDEKRGRWFVGGKQVARYRRRTPG